MPKEAQNWQIRVGQVLQCPFVLICKTATCQDDHVHVASQLQQVIASQ